MRWGVTGVCFLMAVFAWGAVFYGHSVYLDALQRLHGWSAGLISSAILAFWLASIPGTLLVGAVVDRRGPAPVLGFGALCIGIGVIALGRLDAPWQLFAVYVLMGLGYPALATAAISAALAPWFARRFGFALGLALSGASLGGAVLPPLLVALSAGQGFAAATAWVGGAMLAPGQPAAALLGRLTRRRRGAAGAADASPPAPLAVVLASPAFWAIAVAGALDLGAQVGFLAHQVPILAPELGARGAALAVTVVALAAAVGRLAVGGLSRYAGPAQLAAACYLVQAAGFALLLLADGPAGLYAGCALAGVVVGAIVLLPPILVRQRFGAAGYGRTYAAVNVVLYVGAGLGPWLAGQVRDLAGSYAPALWLLGAMHVVAAVILLARPPAATTPHRSAPRPAPPARHRG